MKESIKLENGKYELIFKQNEGILEDEEDYKMTFKCLRNGEEWRNLIGDKLVFSMFHMIRELQEENKMNEQILKMRNNKYSENEYSEIVQEMKNYLAHIKAHKQVIENLEYNCVQSDSRDKSIEMVEHLMDSKYMHFFKMTVKDYIKKKVEDLFESIVKDFDLKNGGIRPGDDLEIEKFEEVIANYIENNYNELIYHD